MGRDKSRKITRDILLNRFAAKERIIKALREQPDLLQGVGWSILRAINGDHRTASQLARWVAEVALGRRVKCPLCRNMVYPGFMCWGCGDWVAPGREERSREGAQGQRRT